MVQNNLLYRSELLIFLKSLKELLTFRQIIQLDILRNNASFTFRRTLA